MTTDELIDDFAEALKRRLRQTAIKGKYGWEEEDWEDVCLEKMVRSAIDEDVLDTAAYAAFAWHHGWGEYND